MEAHVLILGGTGDARLLAARLAGQGGWRITLSLAGRTRAPLPQAGELRVGGFGGAEGLADFLRAAKVDLLVDATHPFAARISANARHAAAMAGVPLRALQRPPWRRAPGDRWIEVPDIAGAIGALDGAARRVFLAIGRQEVAAFRARPQHRYLVRSVEPVGPEGILPDAVYILDKGPFEAAAEEALLRAHGIELIVAKNSGGTATEAKILAARALGLPVVMIGRPPPSGAASFESLTAILQSLAHWRAERGE